MLGRHVYRVRPLASGEWSIEKDGETALRARRPTREEAAQHAAALACRDEPSKVIVEANDGAIAEERLFGADTAQELDEASRGVGGR